MTAISKNIQREAYGRDQEVQASRGITSSLQKLDGALDTIADALQQIQDRLETGANRTEPDGQGGEQPAPEFTQSTIDEVNSYVAIFRDGGLGVSGQTHVGLVGMIGRVNAFLGDGE